METKLAKRKEDPFITPWHRLLDDVFDMRPFFDFRTDWDMPGLGTGWAPAVDVAETAEDYLIRAEVPGLRKEDVKLSLSGNVLTISGEKKMEEKKTENKKYHRLERSYGAFQRSFSLPTPVNADKITATFKDGMLEVTVPKSEEAKTKVIDIKVE